MLRAAKKGRPFPRCSQTSQGIGISAHPGGPEKNPPEDDAFRVLFALIA